MGRNFCYYLQFFGLAIVSCYPQRNSLLVLINPCPASVPAWSLCFHDLTHVCFGPTSVLSWSLSVHGQASVPSLSWSRKALTSVLSRSCSYVLLVKLHLCLFLPFSDLSSVLALFFHAISTQFYLWSLYVPLPYTILSSVSVLVLLLPLFLHSLPPVQS